MNRVKRLIKYLAPYKVTIVSLIFVMFFQQICSLFLPTLMSEIVDVGIRQSGIESAAPEAMTKNAYNLITSFMTNEQKKTVKDSYSLVGKSDIDGGYDDFNLKRNLLKKRSVSETYPLIEEEKIYLLKRSKEDSYAELESSFEKSTLALINYIKESGKEIAGANESEFKYYNIDLNAVYPLADEAKKLTDDYIENLSANNPSGLDLKQASAMLIKEMYKELKADIVTSQSAYILRIGAFMLIITVVSMMITIYESYLSSRMSSGISKKLRSDVFNKIESFSNKEFDELSTSSLITRTTNDVSQVKEVILTFIGMIGPPVMLVGSLIMAVKKSASMSWTIALGALVSAGILAAAFVIVIPKIKRMQKILDKFNLITRERLTGTMVIKSFGTSLFEETRFRNTNSELTGISLFVNRILTFMSPVLMIFMNFVNVLIIWLGAYQIENSNMQVGDMIAFSQYASMVIGAFLMIMMTLMSFPRAIVSVNRVCEILEKEASIKDPENPKHFKNDFKGEIEFKNVSFKYFGAEENVIDSISFKANPGEVTAIIGSTGSGKSTLASLIPRFYDVTEGEVLIDGINVKDLKQSELRGKIGFVSQKGVLFSGDIESNLKYGRNEVTHDKIEKCIEITQIKDFIESQEDGLKMKISQGGNNLSGGQRQRLCIARALVKSADIYIFDDSFSALDFKTDANLRRALFEYTKNSTVIIVSQRVGTVMSADKIIVMDKGKIVGIGDHKYLSKNCSVYKEIALSQLPEEEMI